MRIVLIHVPELQDSNACGRLDSLVSVVEGEYQEDIYGIWVSVLHCEEDTRLCKGLDIIVQDK